MLAAMKLLVRWLLLAAALLLVAHLYSGVQVKSFGAAMIAALVIGLFNALLRPILVLLALIGSLIYSLCGMVIDVAMERLFAGR